MLRLIPTTKAVSLYYSLAGILAVFLGLIGLSQDVGASVTTKAVSNGITLTEEIDSNPPEIIHVLTVDLSTPGVHLEVIPGQDTLTGPSGDIHQGRAEVRQIATNHSAVAAVNGDYFPFTGDPFGAAVWNGNLYSEPYPGRSVMGVGADGRTIMFDIINFLGELQNENGDVIALSGVDRMVSATDTNDLVVFTPTYGPKAGIRPGCTEVVLTGVTLPLRPSKLEVGTVVAVNPLSTTGSPIPADGVVLAALPAGQPGAFLRTQLKVGDKAEFVCALAPQASLTDALKLSFNDRDSADLPVKTGAALDQAAYDWATASQVVGGGPRLIEAGKVAIDGVQEGFQDSFINDPNPRTAVGLTSDGHLLIVTVDGRQSLSKGVSLNDLAKIMLRYGAVDALNLDGGGSTTMAVRGMVVNSIASTGVERPVANALCVIDESKDSGPARVSAPAVIPAADQVVSQNSDTTFPSIKGIISPLIAGQSVQLSLQAGKDLLPGDSPDIIWGGSVGAGIGYVSQTGLFSALSPGDSSIDAYYDGQLIHVPVKISANGGSIAEPILSAAFHLSAGKSQSESTLDIGVFTATGMPVAGAVVSIAVAGGSAKKGIVTTDVDGYTQTVIHWSGEHGSVTLSSNNLVSKIIQQP